MFRRSFLFLACWLAPAVFAQDAPPGGDRVIDATERKAVIDGVLEQINKVYVFPDVARKMQQAVRARREKKEYDAISSGKELARVLTDHLRAVSKDGHLHVEFSAEPRPKEAVRKPSDEEIRRFRSRGARRNYEFKKVEQLDGGIGLLELNGFYSADWIAETIAGAMSFLANSEAVILDLRRNGGGDPDAVNLLCSYFFNEPTRLSDHHNRAEGTTRQNWTYPVVPGRKLADKDLYILTSQRTFSAPESLAYDMQALKRATIVGETTGGGAHGTTNHWINDHFHASIPFSRSISPVTGTDWEGTGVKPDVAVPADQALLTAHLMALRKALEKHADDRELADDRKRTIDRKTKELAALKGAVPGGR